MIKMAHNSYYEFVTKNNYEINKNVAYGKVDDYLITIYQDVRFKLIIIPLPKITDDQKKQLVSYLKSRKKEMPRTYVYFDNRVLVVKIKEPFTQIPLEQFEKTFDIIMGYIKDNHISSGKPCIFCGNEGAHETIKITNIEYYYHRNCYDKAIKEIEAEQEKLAQEEVKQNYNGFIGALVGSILFGVLWAIFYEKGLIPALFMFFLPTISLRFHQAFKGKFTKNLVNEIILANFIVLFIVIIVIIIRAKINLAEMFTKENQVVMTNIFIGITATLLGNLLLRNRFKRYMQEDIKE